MPNPDSKWLTLNDFSPGIRHRSNTSAPVSSTQILGAADPSETYRCIALPGGGLGPLPKRTENFTSTNPSGLSNSALLMDGVLHLVGMHVTGPYYSSATYTDPDYGWEIHLAYEWGEDSNSNGTFDERHWYWERIRGPGLSREQVRVEDITGVVSGKGDQAGSPCRGTFFCDARMDPSDPTLAGQPVTVASWFSHLEFGGVSANGVLYPTRVWATFPDPGAPTTLGTEDISTARLGTLTLQHQGRVVLLEESIFFGKGEGSGFHEPRANEDIIYTNVNLETVIGDFTTDPPVAFGQGQYIGYGAAYSISAQELLLIHHRGGAIAISGDLDNPTVTTLAGVMGTHGAVTIGTPSPVGFVYGVGGGGVYAWQGGDNSVNLSPFLNDDFWKVSGGSGIYLYDGKFDLWNDWILCPNNWLYDTITKSWWRIEDTDLITILHWGVTPYGTKAIGVPKNVTVTGAATTNPVWYGWERDTPSVSYRWKSQVIAQTIDKKVSIQEVTIHATGPSASTVTVTVYNEAGSSASKAFTLTSASEPKLYRGDLKIEGTCLRVQIDCDGGSNPAPNLWDVNFRIEEQQHQGKS